MSGALIVRRAGPQMTVQDMGRTGFMAKGLSRGGAADRLALCEAAALLHHPEECAALEMAGAGGRFEAKARATFALTGAPMPATIDGRAVPWNSSFTLEQGSVLDIGPAKSGMYGYLSVHGGVLTEPILGSRSAHLVAGIGRRIEDGDTLPFGPQPDKPRPRIIDARPRFSGGEVRIVAGAQTDFFSEETRRRFCEATFTRDRRGNRQGVRLNSDAPPFEAGGQRTILSEVITTGDIQMTGDGVPFVLLPECQTTGGYPRIGSVIPGDLPMIAQAAPGTEVTFAFVEVSEVVWRSVAEDIARLKGDVRPLVTDPADLANLGAHQLISGVTSGAIEEEET